MHLLVFGFLMITVHAQLQTWDLNREIPLSPPWHFDTTITTTPRIRKINPSCTCTPYYQCVHEKTEETATIPGYGVLDFRPELDEEQCEDSLEVCCKSPKDTKPQSDPAKVKGCGYRNPNGVGPTLKNVETQFGEFPWVVALLDSRNSSYVGAGVLISPEVVMTGAHIAYKFTPGSLKIRAGEWNTQSVNELYDHQERDVKEIMIHEEFNMKNLWNDIALLRLEQPVQLSEHINVICLPEQDEVFDNHTNCVANGWGKDVFGREGQYVVIMKKQEANIVPHEECNKLLKRTRLGTRFILHDSFLCAGEDAEHYTCRVSTGLRIVPPEDMDLPVGVVKATTGFSTEGRAAASSAIVNPLAKRGDYVLLVTPTGDGGAPLACPLGGDRYKLTGLVAWGIGCGQKDVPAVYTNVPKFRDWVDDKITAWGL